MSHKIPVADDFCRMASGTKASKTSGLSDGEQPFLQNRDSRKSPYVHPIVDSFENPANLAYLKKLYHEYLNGMPLVHHDLIRE